MEKKFKLVSANTLNNEKSDLAYLQGAIQSIGLTTEKDNLFSVPDGSQIHLSPQHIHLHVITEEKLKVGDFGYSQEEERVFQVGPSEDVLLNLLGNKNKVIATSDKSFGLPLIDYLIINKFWLKQGLVDEVTLSFEDDKILLAKDGVSAVIKIEKPKKYTKQEIIDLINQLEELELPNATGAIWKQDLINKL